MKHRYRANDNLAPTPRDLVNYSLDPFYPRFWEERIAEPTRGYHKADWYGVSPDAASKKGIFVCDMSDLFGIGIPKEWTKEVMDTIKKCSQDRFYLLTKQPQNLIKFSPFPPNCYVGVTATNTEMFMQACSHLEYPVQAKVKFISIEPFLDWDFNWNKSYLVNLFKRAGISWVIIGAQTKPTIYPKIEWVEEIEGACNKAGIAVFEKNNLSPLLDYNLRQEMP